MSAADAVPAKPKETTKGVDNVLIAVDGSDQAEDAFSWYLDHLHRPGNTLVLVHSMELPAMPTRDSWDHQMDTGKKKRLELQDKYQSRLTDAGITGKFICDHEKPGEFVISTAKKEGADYIVMGTRGLGKIRRTIMGSVSDFVVHHATCPVIVCRFK